MSTADSAGRVPTREEVDGMPGGVVLEFGTDWCPHCRATRSAVDDLVRRHPGVRYFNIEDGPGRPLGRSFRVKLWPTLVFLRDGRVLRQLVRPSPADVEDAFRDLAGSE